MAIVKLLGELGELFGEIWDLEVRTPVQALQLIGCQTPGFVEYLANSDENGIHWRVSTIAHPIGMDEDQLAHPMGDYLVIAPVVTGSGGFGKILLGAALIGAAFLVPGGFLGISATTIGLFGASLVLGGISDMLTPRQKTPKDREKLDSHLFNDASGTTAQGKPVAIAYGEGIWTGFPILSSGITTNEVPA